MILGSNLHFGALLLHGIFTMVCEWYTQKKKQEKKRSIGMSKKTTGTFFVISLMNVSNGFWMFY